jgi:hypothetical protein
MRSSAASSAALAAVLAFASSAAAQDAADVPPPKPGKVRLLMLELDPGGVSKDVVRTIEGLIAVELQAYDAIEVLTAADMRSAVELESMREAMGCDEASCLSELAGALGAELIIHGKCGSLGSLTIVNLNLFDSNAVKSLSRVAVQAPSLEQLPGAMNPKMRELLRPFYAGRGISMPGEDAPAPVATTTMSEPAPADPPPAAVASSGGPGMVPWVVAGAGGVVGLIGLGATAFGVMPPIRYELAVGELEALESKGSLTPEDRADASAAYILKEDMKRDWGEYGIALTASGLALTAVGVAVLGGGAAWALMGGSE